MLGQGREKRQLWKALMEHKFTIIYRVNNDIPICPDHIHKEIKKAIASVQADIDYKKLNGEHKLEIQPAGSWFK